MNKVIHHSSSEFSNVTSTSQQCETVRSILSPSGTPVRRITPATLAEDGFMLGCIRCVLDDDFQRVQQEEYAAFKPGENAVNQLARRTAWGAYINGHFHWHDRRTYSLPKELNSEENGAVRIFERAGRLFLHHQVTEQILRAIFAAWSFEHNCSEQLYQVQLSLIRYEPSMEEPAWPSPIAPHQDMVDGAIVVLHRTENLVGGLSRIYDLSRRPLVEMDLRAADVLFVRDADVLHQVTPLMLEPGADWSIGQRAYRDVMLVRFQAVGR